MLTSRDAEEIRCVLEAHMHTPAARQAVHAELEPRVAGWRVGAPRMDGGRPRMGEFWVQSGDSDDEVLLSTTLVLRDAYRYGLDARLTRSGEHGWQVVHFAGTTAHRRR